MGTGAAVSQQLSSWRRTLAGDPKWEAAKTELVRKLAAVDF